MNELAARGRLQRLEAVEEDAAVGGEVPRERSVHDGYVDAERRELFVAVGDRGFAARVA